jgi:hypothetical protein
LICDDHFAAAAADDDDDIDEDGSLMCNIRSRQITNVSST